MANKSKFRRETEIRVAAWHFANTTRDAKQIARTLGVSERTIHRYAEDPVWQDVLNEWCYEGPQNFRVQRAGRKKLAKNA